jgi:regulator of protease activity HflC (stomatin/prohibitin superfamily)
MVLAAVGLFVLMSAWLSAFNTQAGTVDIVLRWGAPVRVTEPGLNFKIPYVETRHTVELRERAFTKTYESASRDPMELNVSVALNWAVNKEHVVQMYNQFGDLDQFEQRIIAPRLPDAVKAVVSRFAVNELLTKRNELRDLAKAAALAVIPQQIMTITGFAVTNVEFPKAYTQQIAAVQVAREAANAQEQELRKQNFKAQEVFNTAKAQADATKAQADAEAYSIAIKGKAQLDIQQRQAEILKGNPLLIDWERAVRLVPGVLPQTFVGGDGSAALMFQLGSSQPAAAKK